MTQPSLSLAINTLIEPQSLRLDQLQSLLQAPALNGCDAADIYLQYQQHESWVLDDGIIKDCAFGVDSGLGFRAQSESKTAFAYADDISLASLQQSQKAVAAMLHQHQDRHVAVQSNARPLTLYPPINPLSSMSDQDKIALLRDIDVTARAADKRIKQVMARLSCSYDVVMICRRDADPVVDVRPLVSLWLRVIVEENDRREQGSRGMGGRYSLQALQQQLDVAAFVDHAVHQAQVNLAAVPAPKGEMPVVLGPGWPGVLLHEAVGHGLEGDFNRKKTSAFTDRLGEQVASPLCTVVDDGTMMARRGSLNVDDEGQVTQHTVLIEKGVLKNYMQDQLNARLMGMQPTGNGRRESYAYRPMPRMTNTYMLAGEQSQEEIIASVDRGIFAVDFAGGQVDITSGQFVFSMSEAYLIEKGKITTPVSGATLIGDGPTVMQNISMVGNDLALDSGIGTCGKDGQSVPVGVGQPSLKIDGVTVGGY